jgi:S-adenosylmethionine:tRNA ribosyltransferase-isomerase
MRIEELDFPYPESSVAVERAPVSRVMLFHKGEPRELAQGLGDLVDFFEAGDVLVINDTRVNPRRVFTEAGLEILFLNPVGEDLKTWQVLCPATRWKNGATQLLPGQVKIDLIARGRPQTVRTSEDLTEDYFEKHGELPLPPYIQKARDERHNRVLDKTSYQTAWAEKPGSLAAPTASLHFSESNLDQLKAKGVQVVKVTLHVGLGTFLPVTVDNLNDHVMHGEWAEISASTWKTIQEAKTKGRHIWALGTTVTRTLESAAQGKLDETDDGGFFGTTDLFIRPGYEFKITDRLLTNFHQPRSTLLALVSAFVDRERGIEIVKSAYSWAIQNQFRLFSYGDLSCWIK